MLFPDVLFASVQVQNNIVNCLQLTLAFIKNDVKQLWQCFFKVFERVSWWNFRVSTPSSPLCLTLLTHFHESARFRPNMLNHLNTTFTFGKQTKDNFINRKVQCRPSHSFIFSFSCPLFFSGETWGLQPWEDPKYHAINRNLR